MGGVSSLPTPDARTVKVSVFEFDSLSTSSHEYYCIHQAMELCKLTMKDLKMFWKPFRYFAAHTIANEELISSRINQQPLVLSTRHMFARKPTEKLTKI